ALPYSTLFPYTTLFRSALNFLALCSTFLGVPLITLLPVFAKESFHLQAKGYSSFMAILGSGAVLGALLVAALTGSSRKGRTVLRSEEHTSELQSRSDLV